jgi:hypothetical protein
LGYADSDKVGSIREYLLDLHLIIITSWSFFYLLELVMNGAGREKRLRPLQPVRTLGTRRRLTEREDAPFQNSILFYKNFPKYPFYRSKQVTLERKPPFRLKEALKASFSAPTDTWAQLRDAKNVVGDKKGVFTPLGRNKHVFCELFSRECDSCD